MNECGSTGEDVACEAKDDVLHYDADNHWKLCVCGNKVEVAEHSFVDGECECGAEEGSVAAEIVWSVYTGSLEGTEWTNEDDIKALIKGLAATQFVSERVTFTIDSNYRVVKITNDDYDTEKTTELTANANGEYSFVAASGNEIKIAVVRQYTVNASAPQGVTVTVEIDGDSKSLPVTVDEGTSVKINVSLSDELAETKILKSITYTLTGGNEQTISNGANITVNQNALITVTIDNKPAATEQVLLTLDYDSIYSLKSGSCYTVFNGDRTKDGYTFTTYQVMQQSSVMQWKKNEGYITVKGQFTKIVITSSDGTFTVTNATSKNGEWICNDSTKEVEYKISVGSATGKTSKIEFYGMK